MGTWWKSDKFWLIVGAVAAVVIVPITVWLYYAGLWEQSRAIDAVVISTSSLVNPQVSRDLPPGDLSIQYKGSEVSDLKIITVMISNSGHQSITAADIDEPLRITLRDVDHIISAKIVDAQPSDLRMTADVDVPSKSIELGKKLLNDGDCFCVEIVVIPTPPTAQATAQATTPLVAGVTGRVKGVKSISFRAEPAPGTPGKGLALWNLIGASLFTALASVVTVLVISLGGVFLKKRLAMAPAPRTPATQPSASKP